ncbi:MAG: flagellar hook-basal body complex protein, partial [Rhodospirillales bacterium]|nr:flagellar hook-basal body complex protein [Rhodospirillales bacterium]
MSLFGALSSGVSGLTAQSSAMGAISDNITNVSTVGYKNTQVDFQTLVTTQTSSTFYSAGGVQSRPRQDTGVQGLLASSTSQTDVAISGSGYFVVNESATPTINNEFLFTRAGSFFQDNEGYLRNTSGFYLQAWPVTANGTVTPNNESLSIPNQNVISTDYLATVNLNRVGGTAAATTTIGIGANLPSNDTTGQTHKTDVQFFDTLGNANTMSFVYTKQSRDNQWDATTNPPPGAAVLTLEDSSGGAYKSIGQLEFIDKPNEGSTVAIDGVTYEFSADATVTTGNTRVTTTATSTTAQDVAALIASVIATDTDFDTVNQRIKVDPGSSTTVLIQDDGTKGIAINPTGLLTSSGTPATNQQTLFSVRQTAAGYRNYEQFKFGALPVDGDTVVINGITYEFEASGNDDTQAVAAATTTANVALGAATQTTTLVDDFVAAAGGIAEVDTVEITGTYEVGDSVSIDVGGGADVYTVVANDLTANGDGTGGAVAGNSATALGNIATKVSAALNAGTTSATHTASVAAAVVSITHNTVNTDFTTTVTTGNVAAVAQVDTLTLSGVYEVGDVVSVNLGGGADTYTVVANDLTANGDGTGGTATQTQYLTNIAIKVEAAFTASVTGVATSPVPTTPVITLTAVTPGTAFTSTVTATNLSGGGITAGRTTVVIGADIATVVANLETAIETADPEFASGSNTVRTRQDANSGAIDTLMLSTLGDAYTVTFNLATTTDIPTHPDGTSPYTSGTAFTIDKSNAIVFDSDGLPSGINIVEAEILDFENGAANMDDDPSNSPQITLDFGDIASANGMTQFGGEFT